jgi:ubiquinol-cytochrome c reductase cytochrome c subunit
MKMLTGVLGLGVLIASLTGAAQTSTGASSATLVGNAATGKETFTQYCSICHGTGAQGFIGPHIAGINWTVGGLHTIVRNGLGGYGGMPAFRVEAVTDQNIADIAAYLASLQPASPPASSPLPSASSSPTNDIAHGHQVYMANCAACHGASAQGGVGPALTGEKNRKDTAAAIAWIKNPKLPMPKLYPDVLSEKDVEDVAAYIESL